MKYFIIGSGSTGNCIILEDKIMLDCGVAYSKIKPFLPTIKLIFISHIHSDHLNSTAVKHIAYNYPNVKFICGNTDVIAKLVKCGVAKQNIFYLKKDKWYGLGLCKVKLEELTHDVPNHALKCEIKGKKMIYIVDTSNVKNIKAKDYDLYLIESNYREDILKQHIRECEDKDKLYYLNRVPYTHLSYEQANAFLIENMGTNSFYQYVHTSSYNFEEREE